MLWRTLRQLKSNNLATRYRAVRKIGESRDLRAVEPLVAALKDIRLRTVITEVLVKIGDASMELLIKALKESDAPIAAILKALRLLKTHSMTSQQRARLRATLEEWRPIEPLIHALNDDPSYFGRADAAEALGKLRDRRAINPLIDALKDSKVRASAALAWWKLEIPALPGPCWRCLSMENFRGM